MAAERPPVRVLYLGGGLGAYPLIRSLRHGTQPPERIAVLVRPEGPLDLRASRWVDEVVMAPSELGNEVLLAAARQTRATHVVPTNDDDALLLAELAPRLAQLGAVACTGSRAGVATARDKSALVEAAARHRVPVPRMRRLRSERDAVRDADDLGYPLIVKARYSHGANGVRLVRSPKELLPTLRELLASAGSTGMALHEYVPGGNEPSVTIFMGARGTVELIVAVRKRRYAGPSRSCALRTIDPPPETPALVRLIADLGLRGPVTVQLKHDQRSGQHKLVEINPRLGQNSKVLFPLLNKAGIDPAERFLDCFAEAGTCHHAGQPGSGRPVVCPPGLEGAAVVEDLAAVVQWRRALRGRSRPDNPPPSAAELARSYCATYASRPALDAITTSILTDWRFSVPAMLRLWPRLMQESPDFIPWGGAFG